MGEFNSATVFKPGNEYDNIGINRNGLVLWEVSCSEVTVHLLLSLSYVMRMKEFERERRLLTRKKRIEQKERAAAAASSS